MKISVDDVELYSLSDMQMNVLKHKINSDFIDADLKQRLQWVLTHVYEQAFKAMKQEWDSKLVANGVESIPTEPDAYAQLVFSQPNYKDRKTRDAEVVK